MTPRQRAEFDRLKTRVRILEARNAELVGSRRRDARTPTVARVPASVDRLRWIVGAIDEVTAPGQRGLVPVSRSDYRQLQQLVHWLDRMKADG